MKSLFCIPTLAGICLATAFAVTAMPALADSSLNSDDAGFLQEAARAAHFDIAAKDLAQQMAEKKAVKAYASKSAEDQQRLLAPLEKLAGDKRVKLPSAPSQGEQAALERLRESKGQDFDREFVRLGARHQFETVEAYKNATAKAVDTDVRGFARTWLAFINAHLVMANSLADDMVPEAAKPSSNTGPARGMHMPER